MKDKPSRKTFRSRLDEMVNQLRKDIMNRTMKPGEYIPSETSLVEQFHLSNKTVRKGLDQLVSEGLIVKIHRIGSMVTESAQRAVTTITLACTHSIERDLELAKLIDDFQTEYPSIRVKTILITSDYTLFVKDNIDSGMIDVFTMNHLNFQEFAEDRITSMLEPLPVNDSIYPFLTKSFTYEDKLYVQPLIFSPIILCYNKTHFLDANLPEPDGSWAWDDLLRSATILSGVNQRYGFYFHLLSENRWPIFLLQSGEKFTWDDKGHCDIRGTKLLDSINLCKALIHNKEIFPQYMSEKSHDVDRLFLQGKISMILTNYMSMNEYKHTDLPYDISPIPFMNDPKTLTVMIGMAVNKYSKEKEAAKLFIQHLSSEKAQRLILKQTLSIPSVKSVAESTIQEDDLNRPSRFPLFRENLGTMRLHQDLNLSVHGFNTVRDWLKMYWSNMNDEATLCEQIQNELTLKSRF